MSDRRNNSFQRALDEAGRGGNAPDDSGAGPTGGFRVHGVALGVARGSGGKARFGLALDWTDEPPDRSALPPQRQLSQPVGLSGYTSIEIATELGLGTGLTLDQLGSRWRDFVWRNHPDRQPEAARERANARVAIANTLYDRARRDLAKAR